MGLFSTQTITGDLWLRSLDGNIQPSTDKLSAIYLKYQPINELFFNELSANQITRFDMFYDTIFLETNSGFIFEKIDVDSNNNITPYQNNSNYFQKGYTPIEYWFDETNLKIYFVDIRSGVQSTDTFDFYFILTEFDCQTGMLKNGLKKYIKMYLNGMVTNTWGGDNANIEKPLICYNKETKRYNVSFVFRNKLNKIALISIFLTNTGEFVMEKINGLVPFCNSAEILPENIIDF